MRGKGCVMLVEDWLRGCVHHDGRHGEVTLPCDRVLAIADYIESTRSKVEVVRCKDCKHKYLDDMIWNCPFGLSGGENFFCGYGAKDGESDDETGSD